MKATPVKKPTPVKVALRRRAEQRLRAKPPTGESSSGHDLRSAIAELRTYEAELEIQNEELLENRALLNTVLRPFVAHVAPDSLALFRQHLESALASGKMETCELSLRNAAGHETFVRMQSVISRNEKDQTDFYVTLTDLTERHDIEQKLELQKAFAEAAVASKELFFGMLSHELRTPL